MPNALLTPRRLLVLGVMILIVNSLLPGAWTTRIASPLKNIVEMLAVPIRQPLYSLGVTVRSDPVRPLNLVAIQDAQLAVQQLRALEDEVARLKQENHRLRRIREVLGEDVRFTLVEAQITGIAGTSQSPVLRIDRGTSSGLTAGSVVTVDSHLVGEVLPGLGPMTAEVRAMTNSSITLNVRFVPPIAEPMLGQTITERISWSDEHQAFVKTVAKSFHVKVGDLAHLSDDGWKREAQGFIIGSVTDVRDDPKNPLTFKQVVVRPPFNLKHLRRVTILVKPQNQ